MSREELVLERLEKLYRAILDMSEEGLITVAGPDVVLVRDAVANEIATLRRELESQTALQH